MRRLWLVALLGGLFAGGTLAADQDLSQQVLRLLVRNNVWTGTNTYDRTVGVTLESGATPPVLTANTLYNLGGNLYFNGVLVATSAGVGTVTSVGLALPAIFTVSNSPVTASGTLTAVLAVQVANTIWAGPATGADAAPTFRALVDADIPNTLTISCTGCVTWASVSKSGSSLADLATRSAADLSSGTLPDARFPATLPAASGVNLTALNATNLASGTVAAARMPALTGDVTSSVGTVATTLANSGVSAGSYTVASITVDAKGRVTAASSGSAGTGTVTHTAGNLTASALMVGNGTADSKVLASLGTTTTLLHGNAAGLPTFAAVSLTADVGASILGIANGGTATSGVPTNGQVLIGNGTNYTRASITGTASQITVTGGVGSITLALPQAIATGSAPQFARLGLGTGAGATAVITTTGVFDTGYFDNGNCAATDTVSWAAGMAQKSTFTGSCTLTFTNPTVGTWFTLAVIQGGAGSFTATWPGTVIWDGNVAPTLSTSVGATDICSFFWTGTTYYGRCLIGS